MNAREAAKHLLVMRAAANKAAALQLKNYGKLKKSQISAKTKNDFVTAIDKKSQDLIVATLKKAFPSYGYKAEEGLYERRERMWVVDPLDGTSNYIHQFPMFCISIALTENDRPVCGLVYDALHDECFTAWSGGGARLNGRPIRVSGLKEMGASFLATGFPYRMRPWFEAYHKSLRQIFYQCAGIRRGGSAALDLCYTACGRVDGFWEFGLSEWDLAAGALIVQEAGGVVSDFAGKGHYAKSGNVVAGTRVVQSRLVKVLKKIRGFDGSGSPHA